MIESFILLSGSERRKSQNGEAPATTPGGQTETKEQHQSSKDGVQRQGTHKIVTMIMLQVLLVLIFVHFLLAVEIGSERKQKWMGRNRRPDHGQKGRFSFLNQTIGIMFSSFNSSVHYGRKWKKHRQNSLPIIHFPTSEGVSEVSERANE